MPWAYILRILGPGLHWGRSQDEYQQAILQAEKDGQFEAAHHLKIIWRLRNQVMMEKEPGTGPGQGRGVRQGGDTASTTSCEPVRPQGLPQYPAQE